MKKTMTVNLKDIKIFVSDFIEIIIKNRRKLILTVLSVFGLWCGTRIYVTEPEIITNYFSYYIEILTQQKFTISYLILFSINVIPVIITIKYGFFAFGSPISILCPCLSGIFTGIINAWAFNNYRLNGVFLSLLSIIPFAVITMIININSSNESIDLSKIISEVILINKTGSRGEVKSFFIKQIIAVVTVSIMTLIQLFIIKLLLNKLILI